MAIVVNSNIAASIATASLAKNGRALSSALEKLSTGSQINSAADNASGLAITTRLTSQIRALTVAVANANDAVSMISTADGALIEVQNMLQRMRELALQAATGTNAAQDRSYIDTEFQQLHAEVTRIANNTQWNGRNILDGSAGGAAGKSSVKFMVSHHVTRTDIGTTTGEAVNHDEIIGFTPAEITAAGQWSGTGTATGVPPTTNGRTRCPQ